MTKKWLLVSILKSFWCYDLYFPIKKIPNQEKDFILTYHENQNDILSLLTLSIKIILILLIFVFFELG